MLYDLAIAIYDILVHLAAPFRRKPRKMMKGHWVVYERQLMAIWFHAASLGEFSRDGPLREFIAKYPDYGILLTFFSPSGYEVRKNIKTLSATFFRQVPQCEEVPGYRESCAFIHQLLEELSGQCIYSVYSISSIFRRGQVFFKWYGGTYRHVLRDFDHLFVQNERSKRYLAKWASGRWGYPF